MSTRPFRSLWFRRGPKTIIRETRFRTPLAFEQLEDRWVPTSLPPGNYSGTFTGDSEFDQAGTYTISGNLTVNPGVTLRVGLHGDGSAAAGVNVVINRTMGITMKGAMLVSSPSSFAIQDGSNGFGGGSTFGIEVLSGGSFSATSATFSRVSASNGPDTTFIQIDAGARFASSNSTFGWDLVTLSNNSTLNAGSVTGSAFDGTLAVQARFIPILAGGSNQRFHDININTGSTSDPTLTLGPIGADTSNQRYVFPGNFTVAASTTLNVPASSTVVINRLTTLTVAGTLNVTNPTLFAIQDTGNGFGGGSTFGIEVTSGGSFTASSANLTRLNNSNGADITQILVDTGGTFAAHDSTFGWDQTTLSNNAIVPAGGITNSAFDGTLAVQAKVIPVLAAEGNQRFHDININSGTTTDPTLSLAPIGADTSNLRYVFPGNFTIAAGTSVSVASNATVVINRTTTLTVAGTLNVTSPTLFAIQDSSNGFGGGSTFGIEVTSGGSLTATSASFTRLNNSNGVDTTQILVDAGGSFAAHGSTLAWDQVTLANNSLLPAGSVTNSAFDGVLSVQAKFIPILAAGSNLRFQDVNINAGTTTDPTLTLTPIGADTSNQRFVFAGNFSVAAGTTLAVPTGSTVLINRTATVMVSGTMTIVSPTLFAIQDSSNGFGGGSTFGLEVANGGTLSVTNAVFSRASGSNGVDTTVVQVDAGGLLIARGASFGWDAVTFLANSHTDVQYNFFNTKIQINSGAILTGNSVRNNDFSPATVLASGSTGTTINLTNNYWGTTVTSVIDGMITDHNDTAALPTVNYLPVLVDRPVRPAADPTPPVPYNGGIDQNIPVSATFTAPSSSGTIFVNEGTATFTILQGVTVIGSPVTVNVVNGAANTFYILPAGTAGGSYTIQVTYNGTANFAPATDNSQVFTITPVAASGSANSSSATFNSTTQSVNVSASLTSAFGVVSGGTVTFTVLNGVTVIGSPIIVNVVNGAAAGSYNLPGGLAGGTYSVQIVYSGTSSFTTFTNSTQSFTINAASSIATVSNATVTYSGTSQSVGLTTTVTSTAGVVSAGTVTFTIKNGATVIGTPITVNVANGAVIGNYNIPSGLAGGTYTILAVYNGSTNFATTTDSSHSLTITAAASASAAANASIAISVAAQSVNLSATVTSPAGIVNGGTVTFTIKNGATVIGTPTPVTVVSGVASGGYTLPGGLAVGAYSIQAIYNGTTSFLTSTDSAHSLTVTPTLAIVAAAAASITFNGNTQSVSVSATVTSSAGTVSEGTVTFTIKNGATVIGTPVTVNVVSGAAGTAYSLPAGTVGGTYTIQAVYSGTANFSSSTDISHSLTINAAAATAASPDATVTFSAGVQSVNLSATVTSAAGTVSGGTVTFTIKDGATVIGSPVTVNVAAGAAACSYSLPAGLSSGSYTIQAAYSGTSSFTTSTDTAHTLTINTVSSATAAAAVSVAFSAGGMTANLAATITTSAGSLNVGTVTFTILNGATVVGTPITVNVVNGAAAGSYSLPAGTSLGTYTIQADFSGTTDIAASTDSSQSLIIAPASTTAAAAATASYSGTAQSVNVSASVTSTAGTVNEGSITFTILNGATVIGTPLTVNVANGAAAGLYTLPAGTAGGTYTIQATFNGTVNFAASTDASQSLTVSAVSSTTVAVAASATFNSAAQSVNLSANVTSTAGTVSGGTVTFTLLSGATVIGTPVTVSVVSGAAAGSYPLPAGTDAGLYTIQVDYSGTSSFVTSSDSTQSLTINAAASTSTAAAASATFSGTAQSVNVSATVTSTAGTVGTGAVTFTILSGATVIGTPLIVNVASGAATGSYSLPAGTAGGTYTIQAVYGGSTNFATSMDATHHLTINAAVSTTVTTSTSTAFSINAQTVSLSATLTSAIAVNAGTVTFTIKNGATVIGSPVTVNVANGAAAASYTLPAGTTAGTYTIQVAYSGTANFAISSDTTHTLTVTPPLVVPLLVGFPQFAVGTDKGGSPTARSFNPNGTQRLAISAFDATTTGGVRTAGADFNRDGIADIVVGTGPGVPTLVRVLDGVDGHELFRVAPFEAAFLGGVYVAAGDVTGDGTADLVITPDEGGGPRIELFRGGDFHQVGNFFGIDDSNFRGGARASIGDLTGDGFGDLVISAGFGGGPRISTYDGKALTQQSQLVHPIGDFFLFEPALRNGAFVAAGDVNGDGFADIIGGGGPGGGPRVYALGGKELMNGQTVVLANFFAGNVENRGGIRVGVKDLDGDRFADIVVGDGTGAGSHVTAYHGSNFHGGAAPVAFEFDAFPGFSGGVFVG